MYLPTPEDLAPPATIAEADAEWARNVGAQRPDSAWILSDRDVWYRNPAYTGPAVGHPDDDDNTATHVCGRMPAIGGGKVEVVCEWNGHETTYSVTVRGEFIDHFSTLSEACLLGRTFVELH